MSRTLPDDRDIVVNVKLGKRTLTFYIPLELGVTPERKNERASILEGAARVASRVLADSDGLTFVWDDESRLVLKPPAWDSWWGGRSPVEGWRAHGVLLDFTEHLWRDVVGPKLEQGLSDGKIKSLWAAVRDFPLLSEYSPDIQARLRGLGQSPRQTRGQRSPEHRMQKLDRWLMTVSRVDEYRRQGYSLEKAYEEVARIEGRDGEDPATSVRGEYERGMRWHRLFK